MISRSFLLCLYNFMCLFNIVSITATVSNQSTLCHYPYIIPDQKILQTFWLVRNFSGANCKLIRHNFMKIQRPESSYPFWICDRKINVFFFQGKEWLLKRISFMTHCWCLFVFVALHLIVTFELHHLDNVTFARTNSRPEKL